MQIMQNVVKFEFVKLKVPNSPNQFSENSTQKIRPVASIMKSVIFGLLLLAGVALGQVSQVATLRAGICSQASSLP